MVRDNPNVPPPPMAEEPRRYPVAFEAYVLAQHCGQLADEEAHFQTWCAAIGSAMMAVGLDAGIGPGDLRKRIILAIHARRALPAEVTAEPKAE